ncbi:SRPBCC family protein [Flavobacterium sp.]|uniref:SRPBCC family protein n=1 Tax=Flavobacterium sp. TaxID=239 RepID=UPI0039E4483D
MKTKQQRKDSALLSKKNSRIDHSGTDPNRYGGYYSQQEAEHLASIAKNDNKHSLIPGLEANVSPLERMIMVAAGSFLLYRSLSGKKKNIGQGIAGGTMLARGISGYCPVYDLTNNEGGKLKSSNVNIRTSITIDKPVDEVYTFWRTLENLPKFMKHLESVRQTNKITSEWKAKGPAGIGSLSWKSQILMDEKNKMLSWHSLPESTIDNAGKVYFKDLGDRTELDVTISYHAPLGVAGETAAKLLNPLFERMVKKDIESLKTYLESGENPK